MDFSLTEQQIELKKEAIEFAQNELTSDDLYGDVMSGFDQGDWDKCAKKGILGWLAPKELGGSGYDALTYMIGMEGLGYGCNNNGLLFAINAHILSVEMDVLRYGSEEQIEKFGKKLVSGEWIGANGMTEPETGSDCYNLSTTAEKKGDVYVLNGRKSMITNAPAADMFIVYATVNKAKGFMGVSAFLVEKDTPGLTLSEPFHKMGLKTAPMSMMFFKDCEIPASNLLGNEGNGVAIFKHSMAWERGCILANYIGTMERQLDTAIEFASKRVQYGKPIAKYQSVSNRIVDMKVRLETSRALLYKVGWLHAQGKNADQEIAMAKLYVSECMVQTSLDSIQVHGGYGYTAEFGKQLADSVGARIYSGTSEIQRENIARSLGL
jgi:alkylation response protein AidB-like acyl-CoA dehydrogenase